MPQAKGSFEVTVTPLAAQAGDEDKGIDRMRMDKHFHGSLEGTSTGEMLALGDGRRFGAYVAIERIEGALDGRKGGFALVHHARMNEGVPDKWMVTVVPGSGSGELANLSGSMHIEIADGEHRYEFDYTVGDSDEG